MGARAFPIQLASEDDSRFSFGLVVGVADVLVQHGYPRAEQLDLLDLREALYRFLYVERDVPGAGGR